MITLIFQKIMLPKIKNKLKSTKLIVGFLQISLTFRKNNSIIYMYYFKKDKYYAKKILEKDWNVNINNCMCI